MSTRLSLSNVRQDGLITENTIRLLGNDTLIICVLLQSSKIKGLEGAMLIFEITFV
jgi:hypothetical protein